MDTTIWGIRMKFSKIQQVTTEEFAKEVDSRSDGESIPFLLDVRGPEEFAVSTIKGAIHVDPHEPIEQIDQKLLALAGDVGRDHPIVAFCSIGYRSSQLGEQLLSKGWANVRNLEGSIFKWANEGRSVVNSQNHEQEATAVHPYNTMWGKLLKSNLRSSM